MDGLQSPQVNCSTDLKEVSSLLQESTPDAKFVLAWFCNMRTKEITGHLSPIGDFDVSWLVLQSTQIGKAIFSVYWSPLNHKISWC